MYTVGNFSRGEANAGRLRDENKRRRRLDEEGNTLGHCRTFGHASPGADGNGSGYHHDDGWRHDDDDGWRPDDDGQPDDDGRPDDDGDDRRRRADWWRSADQRWPGHTLAGGRSARGFGHLDLRDPA